MARRPTRSQRAQLEALLKQYEPALAKAFRDAAQFLVDSADFAALIRALEAGDIDMAVAALNIRPSSFRAIDIALATTFEAGGAAVIASLPRMKTRTGVRIAMSFDMRNPVAEQRLAQQATGLIQGLTEEAEQIARQYLAEGLAAGQNPRKTALELLGRKAANGRRQGGILGLTDGQASWVSRARLELKNGDYGQYLTRKARDKRFDGTIRRAMTSGKPLTAEQISRITERYSEKLLRYRAETVARTETMEALNSSKRAAYEQTIAETGADADLSVKRWIATKDSRTRDQHRAMDGIEVIGLDAPFTLPDGSQMMHPCDTSMGAPASQIIQCRCTYSVRLVYRDMLQ